MSDISNNIKVKKILEKLTTKIIFNNKIDFKGLFYNTFLLKDQIKTLN